MYAFGEGRRTTAREAPAGGGRAVLAYVRVTRAGREGPLMIFVDATEGAAHAARTAKALAREQGLRLEGEAWAHGVSFFGVGEGGGRTLLVWLGLGPGVPESERRAR